MWDCLWQMEDVQILYLGKAEHVLYDLKYTLECDEGDVRFRVIKINKIIYKLFKSS